MFRHSCRDIRRLALSPRLRPPICQPLAFNALESRHSTLPVADLARVVAEIELGQIAVQMGRDDEAELVPIRPRLRIEK
jgi:hypothetical protein